LNEKIALTVVLVTIIAACTQPVETVVIKRAPVEPIEGPTEESPEPEPEQPAERNQPMIRPVPVYPAYIVEGAAIFGVPSSMQGVTQREQIKIFLEDGTEPTGTVTVFTADGYLYVSIESSTENGPVVDYYRQQLGTTEVENVDDIPPIPEETRAVLDSPAWLIETTTLNGVEWSYLYNRGVVFDEEPPNEKGHFVCRRKRIAEFVVLENGILWQSEQGIEFCNTARRGATKVCEGRLWK